MKYTVTWTRYAKARLAEIWMAAANRQLVADASNRIDRELRNHPEDVGESREGNVRILIAPPLAVDYRVYAADRRVLVLAVWQIEN